MTGRGREPEYEAVVVGGGVVGAAVAYHLAREGVAALLVDRADEGRATAAGAGIVAPATSSRTESEAWYALGVAAARAYPDLAADLAAVVDDHGYARTDLLRVAVDAADVPGFEAALERTRRRTEAVGYPPAGTVREISPDEARERFPPLGEVERALLFEDVARVDGRTLASALRVTGEARGLDVERATAEDVVVTDGRVSAVVVDGERRTTDAVVVAGGAWSPELAASLDVDLPIEPRRGQIVHLDAGARGDWPLVTGRRYYVPWPDGRVAVGATREAGTGFAPHATAGGLRDLLVDACAVAPGLADAEFREVRVGLRPSTPDGLPVLGAAPGVDGAYLATGHGPTGLTIGPHSGRLVADLVRGVEPDPDLAAFAPDRF
jgi:D-amino-acid dehydrogenase